MCARMAREPCGQGTLEYALAFSAVLGMVVVLALLWKAGERGGFAALVEQAASHGFSAFGLADIVLY